MTALKTLSLHPWQLLCWDPAEAHFPLSNHSETASLNPTCFSWLPTKDSTSLTTVQVKAAHRTWSLRAENGAGDSSLHNASSKPLLLHPFRKSLSPPGTCHLVHYLWLSVTPSFTYLQAKPIKEDFGMRITILYSDCWKNDAKEQVGGNQS